MMILFMIFTAFADNKNGKDKKVQLLALQGIEFLQQSWRLNCY